MKNEWVEKLRKCYTYTIKDGQAINLNGRKESIHSAMQAVADNYNYYFSRLTRYSDYETYKKESKPICREDTRTEEQKEKDYAEQIEMDSAIVEIMKKAMDTLENK